eukprot:SAG31_NODE_35_length_31836_cov_10.841352_31_plen_207_part_00
MSALQFFVHSHSESRAGSCKLNPLAHRAPMLWTARLSSTASAKDGTGSTGTAATGSVGGGTGTNPTTSTEAAAATGEALAGTQLASQGTGSASSLATTLPPAHVSQPPATRPTSTSHDFAWLGATDSSQLSPCELLAKFSAAQTERRRLAADAWRRPASTRFRWSFSSNCDCARTKCEPSQRDWALFFGALVPSMPWIHTASEEKL